jgi:hypothetical protein
MTVRTDLDITKVIIDGKKFIISSIGETNNLNKLSIAVCL